MLRKIARENAFLLIFEKVCKCDETVEEIFLKATNERELESDDYVKQVFFGVFQQYNELEQTLEIHYQKWNKSRISPVSKSILLLAAYEMIYMTDIPNIVSLNEAIELAKKYDEEKSYSFVNGVLNAVNKSLEK